MIDLQAPTLVLLPHYVDALQRGSTPGLRFRIPL